ncbi:MAG: PilZ domain-containing protein [Candidatus Acidiferrales bacterium]
MVRIMPEAGVSAGNGKQRRSKRLALNIPVRVYGRTPDNQPFRDITATMSVSAHGGLLQMAPRVKRGQTLLLVNGVTDEERQCRVVYVESKRRTKKVGVEFTDMKGDFWHVYTPMINVKPPANGTRSEEKSDPRS